MPKFLIVAATRFEVQPLIDHFKISLSQSEGLTHLKQNNTDISLLITGIGLVNTAYHMGRVHGSSFDIIINAGICGSFNRDFLLGEVVNIQSDCIAEMGAEDDEQFITYTDMGLGGTNIYENKISFEYSPLNNLKKANAISVNKVHGNAESIEKIQSLFSPDVESMEGAAFFRGCNNISGNYLQLRSISNYVEKRDKSKWNIPLAIGNLNAFLIKLIEDLNT